MNEHDKQSVVERLRTYEAQIQGILDLVAKSPLSQQDKVRAQAQLKVLKERLNADYRRGSTVSGQAELNDVERAFFHPAVHEAASTIRVKWNSNPSSDWSSELYSALIDIRHALSGLESEKI